MNRQFYGPYHYGWHHHYPYTYYYGTPYVPIVGSYGGFTGVGGFGHHTVVFGGIPGISHVGGAAHFGGVPGIGGIHGRL